MILPVFYWKDFAMLTQQAQPTSTRSDATDEVGALSSVLVCDPEIAARLRAEREASEAGFRDEVWDGVYVVSPMANTLHQWLVLKLILTFQNVLDLDGGDRMYGSVNVSDREEGWVQNYRVPDLAVVLSGNGLKSFETHLCGGPDFLVEILSRNDLAREKMSLYEKIGVRELLIVDRYPWALELYRLDAGQLGLVGTSTVDRQDVLTSAVLPLTFRLVPGAERPVIEVAGTDGAQTWRV